MTGHSINTVSKLPVELGAACAAYEDEQLRFLDCQRVQADEIWAFRYAKAKNVPEDKRDTFGYGDVWTWTALDPDTKLIVSWLVSDRSPDAARKFIADLASRVPFRPLQVTTDANVSYKEAIEAAFGGTIDYAQLLKDYGVQESSDGSPTARRYIPQRGQVGREARRRRQSRPRPHQHVARRAVQPDDADGDAPVHPFDQRVFQEGREPRCGGRPALHVRQLRAAPQEACQPLS